MTPLITGNKKIFLLFAIAVSLLSACSKDSSPGTSTSPVDTLSTGWKKITVSNVSFNDILFINNNTGFAIGGPDVFKSSDGGDTWQKVYQTTSGFSNIAMGSESNIIFTGLTNKIVFTKNGGASFDSVNVNDGISDAFFVTPTTAYAVGKGFWRSTNAGSTWTKLYDFPTFTTDYKTLHFLNDQIGWIAGTQGVFKTINGGMVWEQKMTGPEFNFAGSTANVFFVDANTGFISAQANIGKTSSGGNSWSKIFTGSSGYQDLHFISTNTGYFTDGIYIYKTQNGGSTWNKEVVLPGKDIVELHFTDATHGWACGANGTILKYLN